MTHQTSQKPRYLRERELANRWLISVNTLQRWRYSGIGPDYVKFAGRVIYPVDAVELYEKLHLQKPTPVRLGVD